MNVCKYVYHLLLHCEDSIRHCGPPSEGSESLLAMWSMENFVGVNNRRCNATVRLAQSIVEKLKLFKEAHLYCLRDNISIPLFDDVEQPRQTLIAVIIDLEMDGYSLRHPKNILSCADLSSSLNVNFRSLLTNYYPRLGESSRPMASNVTCSDDLVECFGCMCDDSASNEYSNTST